MEARYEIRGKIGQGGLGAVYRGYDTRMDREVAIKRISPSGDDTELLEESTRQLIKEAGALAAFQHPHIVTVYDVGADEDGPYVVMELISGNPLDELIERAPLTWPDFRELVLQTQEALIAAQERNLIHSDLKPSNLMLTWLPSGKFLVKIVDFGLASLARSQTKQELDSVEAVFGSIYFMPPEQFQRIPLETRSDLYSIGCVYYQALTGNYPFNGATGPEVMEAHLQHKVTPLNEVRGEIPLWACNWVMWLLNRDPQDRPASSREALSVFLKNDRMPNPAMSKGYASGPPKPRLHAAGQAAPKAKPVPTSRDSELVSERGPITHTAPQPLAPPQGSQPSVHTSTQELPISQPTATTQHHRPGQPPRRQSAAAAQRRPGLGKNAKIALAAIVLATVAGAGAVVFKINAAKSAAETIARLVTQAEKPGTTELPLTAAELQLLLKTLDAKPTDSELHKIANVLAHAKMANGGDLDERITTLVTKDKGLPEPTKEVLISDVLLPRNNPVILPAMMELATSAGTPTLAVSALQAVRQMAGDAQFDPLLKLLGTTSNEQIRESATLNLEVILKKTRQLDALRQRLNFARTSSVKPEVIRATQRLLKYSDSLPKQRR